jgi:hypothetical protein
VADKPQSDNSANCDSSNMLLRFSGFVGPSVLATSDTWHAIADLVWKGMTVPDAVRELGYEWNSNSMPIEVKRFLVDVSMLANAREEYLGASNDTNN